jgi:SAM-dependent methyltransferase
MFDRRALFQAAAGIGGALTAFAGWRKAEAKLPKGSDLEPRGTDRRLERLPSLDVESREDFLTQLRIWSGRDVRRVANRRANKILKSKGLSPRDSMSYVEAAKLLEDDHIIGLSGRAWISVQQIMWKNLQDEFHSNGDAYLEELEAADTAGPGSVDLNPDMDIPMYAKHEIHMQPGGYVGDPLGGYVYHYGTNNFWQGRNYQDEMDQQLAESIPIPKDGKVKRILHLGCSVGQLTCRIKEKYPDAEVWGLDVGGPMVRYAHMRAADLDIDVHFAQRLAEDTKFPDGHFDLVTSFLLFHEVTSEAAEQIIQEGYRLLRPGGVFFARDHSDKPTTTTTAMAGYAQYWNWRWNHEVWMMDHLSNDYPKLMVGAGFDVDTETPGNYSGFGGNVMGVKPA